MTRQNWISATQDRLVLTRAGLQWLRRRLAGAEPFREQHQSRATVMAEVDGGQRPVVVNEGESPLGWLRRRKDRGGKPMISAEQFAAGERLRADFETSLLRQKVTSSWDSAAPSRRQRRSSPGGSDMLSDHVLAARQRFEHALEAVGPELAGVLFDVCCHLTGLSDAEKSRGWPQRSGKVILQIALTRLARHYGLLREGEGTGKPGTRMRHWGVDGYRPTLDAWG